MTAHVRHLKARDRPAERQPGSFLHRLAFLKVLQPVARLSAPQLCMHVFRRNAGTLSRQAARVISASVDPRASDLATACAAAVQHEQARFVALAQPHVSSHAEHQAAVPQPLAPRPNPADWDSHIDHARRLEEMGRSAAVRSRSLPSPEQVADRLRSHQGASCSTGSPDSPQQRDTEQPGLQWQDIVAALRQGDLQPATRPQILTDTFRCVPAALIAEFASA